MSKLMPILSSIEGHEEYAFKCPGCQFTHSFIVKWGEKTKEGYLARGRTTPLPEWTFDGNQEKPTFSPSLLYHRSEGVLQCHLFLKAGKIQFLSDCDHALKGQTVDCPEFDDAL